MSQAKDLLHGSIASSFFSREQVFQLYSRFKAMCQLSALNNPTQSLVGINFETFRKGVQEGNQLQVDLLKKLFDYCDERKHGILDWGSFLQVMITLNPKTLASIFDSCLNLIINKQSDLSQEDVPQLVNFDHIRMMCYHSLSQSHAVNSDQNTPPELENPFTDNIDNES